MRIAAATSARPWIAAISAFWLIASLGACSSSQAASDDEEISLRSGDADEVKANETYNEYDERRDAIRPSPGVVGKYGCTQDCSAHEAGYQWASERGIDDPNNCGGKSWSFEEGCRAYAEEQKIAGEDAADGY